MHFSYSKKIGGLDYKVWLTLCTVALLSFGVIGYKSAVRVNCPVFKIAATGTMQHNNQRARIFYVNEVISFNLMPNPNGKTTPKWNFGDLSPVFTSNAATHRFLISGNYTITVTVDNVCIDKYIIHIVESPLNNNELIPTVEIIAPDSIMQGDSLFLTTTKQSQSYQWAISERMDITPVNQRDAKIFIPDAGVYTILLKVDNGETFQKQILVKSLSNFPAPGPNPDPGPRFPDPPLPGPPPKDPGGDKDSAVKTPTPLPQPTPPVKNYQQLPDPGIRQMMEGVIDKKKTVDDFNDILCDGGKTKVVANGNVTKFSILVDELSNKKGFIIKSKHKIESFKTTRDPQNGNCVKVIYIDYK